jgi:phosphoribosylformylglycinamidine (FGAM) synthase-like enzyme
MLTAIAEMAIGGRGGGKLGLAIDLDEFESTGLPPEKVLFSETGCFIVELPPGNERELLAICARNRVILHKLGTLKSSPKLEVVSGGRAIASWELGELEEIYMTGCRSIFGIEKGE